MHTGVHSFFFSSTFSEKHISEEFLNVNFVVEFTFQEQDATTQTQGTGFFVECVSWFIHGLRTPVYIIYIYIYIYIIYTPFQKVMNIILVSMNMI